METDENKAVWLMLKLQLAWNVAVTATTGRCFDITVSTATGMRSDPSCVPPPPPPCVFPPGAPDKELNPKKKVWEQVQPALKPPPECVAPYRGPPSPWAGKGVCKAQTMSNSGTQ